MIAKRRHEDFSHPKRRRKRWQELPPIERSSKMSGRRHFLAASFPGSRAHTTFEPKRFVCLGSKVVREIVARRSLGTRLFTALSVSHGGLLLQVERSDSGTFSYSGSVIAVLPQLVESL